MHRIGGRKIQLATFKCWQLQMIKVAIATLAIFLTMIRGASAMDFRIERNDGGEEIIVGNGLIVDGDAGRLEAIIPKVARDQYGNVPLYLNSPGGAVDAAFALVEVMDRYEFSALVPSGARCASACVSIVYISARFHQIIGTGLLGIHTRYVSSTLEPSAFCNNKIARNAIAHGTSYGAVNMWQREGPVAMNWIGQDVACKFGLCGPPGFDGTLAIPSFNCKAAQQPSEIAICSDKRLARHEAELANYYVDTLNKIPASERDAFRAEQRAWLKFRDACHGAEIEKCLLSRMEQRWNEVMRKWGEALNSLQPRSN